jgi:hypothetical protein
VNVVALYVDPRGPYPSRVESWDATRDARLYAGPKPVVAHPPCGPWARLKHLYEGAEHDCGPRAVEQVRAFGGVLEHPAQSKLWDACDLPKPYPKQGDPLPFPYRDAWGGFSIKVHQVEWGHVARKTTWLYIVGVSPRAVEALLETRPYPGRAPTHWASGSRGKSAGKTGNPVPPGIKVCSSSQRRKTPPAFADFLIEIASRAVRP